MLGVFRHTQLWDTRERHERRETVMFVVIAGSKGKERFRRPLRKGSNSSRLRRPSLPPLSSMCHSPPGAGVPAEVRWSWPRHVFGKGFILSQFHQFASCTVTFTYSTFFLRPPTTSPFNFYWFIIFLITSRLLVDYFR